MNVAIIGFGKLGQKISELVELDSSMELILTINSKNLDEFNQENLSKVDVAIELSGPDYASANLSRLAEYGVATVCGSTGWTNQLEEIKNEFNATETAFLYASNFSLGMNIFFEINKRLAQLMNQQPFEAKVKEVHHVHKLDAPSGTALSIADDLIANHDNYKEWKLSEDYKLKNQLEIKAERRGEIKGDHTVIYKSKYEELRIDHSATDRAVFAEGALAAAKFIYKKKGIYSMKDVIGI